MLNKMLNKILINTFIIFSIISLISSTAVSQQPDTGLNNVAFEFVFSTDPIRSPEIGDVPQKFRALLNLVPRGLGPQDNQPEHLQFTPGYYVTGLKPFHIYDFLLVRETSGPSHTIDKTFVLDNSVHSRLGNASGFGYTLVTKESIDPITFSRTPVSATLEVTGSTNGSLTTSRMYSTSRVVSDVNFGQIHQYDLTAVSGIDCGTPSRNFQARLRKHADEMKLSIPYSSVFSNAIVIAGLQSGRTASFRPITNDWNARAGITHVYRNNDLVGGQHLTGVGMALATTESIDPNTSLTLIDLSILRIKSFLDGVEICDLRYETMN